MTALDQLKTSVMNDKENQEKYNKKNDDKIKRDKEIKNLDLEVSHIINEVKMLLDDEEYFREESYIQEDFELKDILNNDNFIFELHACFVHPANSRKKTGHRTVIL